jgi:nucleotide-binding universal stress UspA family protein
VAGYARALCTSRGDGPTSTGQGSAILSKGAIATTTLGAISTMDGEPLAAARVGLASSMKPLEAVLIQKVLVAVDLSNHSKATAMYAAELAKSFDALLSIVYVYKPVPLYDYAKDTTYKRIEYQREELQTLLNELTQRVQKTGLICDSIFLIGDPAEEISTLARDKNVDLIITGSHHPTLLAHLFNLDNAPDILHRAPCPILVYHEKETLVSIHRNHRG